MEPGTYDTDLGPVMLVSNNYFTVLESCAYTRYSRIGTTGQLEQLC